MDEEGLLFLEGWVGEVVLFEDGDEAVPADVAGDVLVAGVGEEVVELFVVVVGSGGALWVFVDEVFPEEAVVEEEEEALPVLGGYFFKEVFSF